MKLHIKKIILDQFKGISHAEYEIGDKTIISGKNGSGKTTIADAYYWVFTDKDYALKASPEIHPDFLEESEPCVTLICDIDGKEVSLRKFQKDSRTKKQIEEGAPVRISNQYEVNAVPKSQKDFFAYLEECGIAIENFLLISHPEVFTGQKSADGRNILFGMVSDISDKEIADRNGFEELGAMLADYTAKEITAVQKRQKKEADENIEAIPNQIIGLEKAKISLDTEEFSRQKETLQAEINSLEEELQQVETPSVEELNKRLALLEKERQQIIDGANADRVKTLTELNAMIGELKTKMSQKQSDLDIAKKHVADSMDMKNALSKRFEALREDFAKIKAREYEADTKCPYCGQELPIDRLDEAAKHFDEEKQKQMDQINIEAQSIQQKVKEQEETVKDLQSKMSALDKEIVELTANIEKRAAEREPLEHVIDASKETESVLQEILSVKHQIAQSGEMSDAEKEIREKIKERQGAMREIDDALAQVKNNERIDEQIAELKEKQKSYAQTKANAEKVLYELSQLSMKKNELLTDQINSHFNLVKFKLFEQQKNGDFKDCCIPTVDGKVFGESANTALMVRAQLDIIAGLQKFYGQFLPVFLDGAEALDENSKSQIDMDAQTIMLCVSENELKVEVYY